MASTVSPFTNTTSMMTSDSSIRTSEPPYSNEKPDEYHTVLLVIYSVVLFCGTISLSLMMHIIRSSKTSITSIAVLNLIFAHFIFLLTVPFRIYYYTTHTWSLGPGWCKLVSGMIHIHMYMSFIFYVIILITRLMAAEQMAPFQSIHALLFSAVVWIVVLVTVPCIMYYIYGNNANRGSDQSSDQSSDNATTPTNPTTENQCFKFGDHIESAAKVFNYIISTVIIVVAIVLTALQANVLWVLYRKGFTSKQEFGAQLKSLCFALIMVVCFIPYHLFRLYYLEHISLQNVNEVFLSLTTFNCLDMLTFLGRRTCYVCFSGKAV